MVATLAVLGVVCVGLVSVALALSAKTQAATAADAAALAAVVSTYPPAMDGTPASRAASVARLNGARLMTCGCAVNSSLEPRVVTVGVVVAVDVPFFGRLDVDGWARAEFDPRAWLGR